MSSLENRVTRLEPTVAQEQRLRAAMDDDLSGLLAMRRSVAALSDDVRDLRDEFHKFRDETRAGRDQTRAGIDQTKAGLQVIIGLLSPDERDDPGGTAGRLG